MKIVIIFNRSKYDLLPPQDTIFDHICSRENFYFYFYFFFFWKNKTLKLTRGSPCHMHGLGGQVSCFDVGKDHISIFIQYVVSRVFWTLWWALNNRNSNQNLNDNNKFWSQLLIRSFAKDMDCFNIQINANDI
jgi:hypothetical protein